MKIKPVKYSLQRKNGVRLYCLSGDSTENKATQKFNQQNILLTKNSRTTVIGQMILEICISGCFREGHSELWTCVHNGQIGQGTLLYMYDKPTPLMSSLHIIIINQTCLSFLHGILSLYYAHIHLRLINVLM